MTCNLYRLLVPNEYENMIIGGKRAVGIPSNYVDATHD